MVVVVSLAAKLRFEGSEKGWGGEGVRHSGDNASANASDTAKSRPGC